jgi:hypothetical protein
MQGDGMKKMFGRDPACGCEYRVTGLDLSFARLNDSVLAEKLMGLDEVAHRTLSIFFERVRVPLEYWCACRKFGHPM